MRAAELPNVRRAGSRGGPHPNPERGQRATFELPGDPGSSPPPTVTPKNL